MIIGNIKNAERYFPVHGGLARGFACLRRAAEEGLAPGKYEIDGEVLYASAQEYETFPEEGRVFEGHKKYIDLQFIVSGRERMEIVDIARAEEITPYDGTVDAAFFAPKETAWSGILEAGDFAILFPEDLHRPGLRADGTAEAVKKIVVKLAV